MTGSGGNASKMAHKITPVHEEAFAVSKLLLSVFQKTRTGPAEHDGVSLTRHSSDSQFDRCDCVILSSSLPNWSYFTCELSHFHYQIFMESN